MLFIPENRDDISKYFRNSFLKFKETGDILFYLENVDSHKVTGTVEDGRRFDLYLASEEPYEVDYILPHKSFFQYGENAVMLQRIPAKQYHRGITADNTMMSFRHGGAQLKVGVDFESLKAFVNKQKFFTLSEALKSEKLSCVLSPRMMYVPGETSIFMDFEPVAKVIQPTSMKPRIKMFKPIFQEEVADFLRSSQESDKFSFYQAGAK